MIIYETGRILTILIDKLKLHDAQILGIKLTNADFILEISCKKMGLKYYFNDIYDILINIKLTNIKKLEFDFLEPISINDFAINYLENSVSVKVNNDDLIVEADKISIESREIKDYDLHYKNLDNFLKSNK